jgi:hypothetical protein
MAIIAITTISSTKVNPRTCLNMGFPFTRAKSNKMISSVPVCQATNGISVQLWPINGTLLKKLSRKNAG